ncbi:Piso0_002478 [Millerozyma farinosa CBS 7064]|uniref:pyridoxal kinase n=1 Tax=Pichia sorbitophila (strain ATCC MYA-4447 / BCRC 22081 / CBS 7064 / NBRC 10061 / NRRL Y-12695) TaxID=559304 RepID=G8YCQ5_PICSO|nr:Piso0_002478 [Millerozyma farinosa CBS 7064]
MKSKSALSISSHVAHGYVGNRAIVFPLQYLGWDVDAINTTNFSNHPGYGSFKGASSSSELVGEIFQGLEKILDISDEYDIILTGYTPSEQILQIVYEEIKKVFQASQRHPALIVDPVLGDNGKLYVSEKVIPLYEKILGTGFVSLTTPNQFEFELLSGVKITSKQSLKEAIQTFYAKFKVPNVVISSVTLDGKSYCVGYSHSKDRLFAVKIEEIDCHFNGCGDLFTAIVAHHFYSNGFELSLDLISTVLRRLRKVLETSLELEARETKNHEIKNVKDIRVVSSRNALDEPLDPGYSLEVMQL